MRNIIAVDKIIQEECGIVGVYNFKPEKNLDRGLLAARGVQHRGLQGCGLVIKTDTGIKTHKANGLLQEVFTPKLTQKFNKNSRWILIHCRYGTHGNYQSDNIQPCIVRTAGDTLAVIHNGEFVQADSMRQKLYKQKKLKFDKDISDTYLFSQLLSIEPGKNWDEKIVNCLDKIKGAYSLMIGIGDTFYVARDPFGIRPLFIGHISDNSTLIASETHAFNKASVIVEREFARGDILKIDPKGIQRLRKGGTQKSHYCDFEFSYFSRPDSSYTLSPQNGQKNNFWSSYSSFRERCGEHLAREAPIKNATYVIGVPDSGIPLAMGYAKVLKLPYRQLIIRDHFDTSGSQRLFMRDDEQSKIRGKVMGKLSIIPDNNIWKNAVVVLGDDSIVRGNVSRELTKILFDWGVKEIHWIVGFPPVLYPCHLGVSIRSNSELIGSRHKGNSADISRDIGANSVNYITPISFLKAKYPGVKIKIPKNPQEIFLKNGGCGGCLTGLYPVSKQGEYFYSKKVNLKRHLEGD